MGRQSVWTDQEVRELTKSFVLCTDEVYALSIGRGPEAEFFQSFAAKGFAGMRQGQTQQGFYYVAPGGELLFSDNTRDPRRAARGMKDALAKWKDLPRDRRLRAQAPEADPSGRRRFEPLFPKDGLVLRETIRDIGDARKMGGDPLVNVDMAWLTAEEVKQLLPASRKGAKQAWPDALVRRLAKLHLVDSVAGLPTAFQDRAVEKASIETTIADVKGDLVTLSFAGETKCSQDLDTATGRRTLTMELTLLGKATWDAKKGRFSAFELVAAGRRSGRPQMNNAEDKPTRIGFLFQLAGDSPADHVPPNFAAAYGWRR
jgi:hypothetical protein